MPHAVIAAHPTPRRERLTMPTDGEFDTIIQAISDGWPGTGGAPVARHEPPARPEHRVLWFALGAALWLLVLILGYALVWLLLHG